MLSPDTAVELQIRQILVDICIYTISVFTEYPSTNIMGKYTTVELGR